MPKPDGTDSSVAVNRQAAAPVSVIIPCYRCSATVERAVVSVMGQSRRPEEIILVDDASDDDTLDVLTGLQERFGRDALRLIRLPRKSGSQEEAMYLLSNVFDGQRMSPEIAASLYEMRWGVEVFYRAFKRTLDQHKLRSDAPEQARWELHWAMTGYVLLGLMTVEGIIQRGCDPLSMSVAAALRVVRQALREPSRRWRRRGDLRVLLALAQKDEYGRKSSKKARDWPYKKQESPPGAPKIREATTDESLRATKLCAAA